MENQQTKAEASQMSGKTDNVSFDHSGNQQLAGKLAGNEEAGTNLRDSQLTPENQKVLVSGSMTIKTQMDQ